MAHNSRSKNTTWVDLDTITGAQFEVVEQNAAAAVNGDGGGVWAPSSKVEIGGLGLSARHIYSLIVVGPNADTTLAVGSARLVYLDATISADRTYTLGATGALPGDVMEIIALPAMSAARTVTVLDNLGATIASLGVSISTSRAAKFVYLGSAWRLLSAQRNQGRQFLDAGGIGSISTQSVSSTSYVPISGFTAGLSCKAGDLLHVTMMLAAALTTSGTGSVKATVVDGGTPFDAAEDSFADFGSASVGRPQAGVFAYSIVYVVQNTGTVTWKGSARVGSGSDAMLLGGTRAATISLLLFGT